MQTSKSCHLHNKLPFGTCIGTLRSYCDVCNRCNIRRFNCLCSEYVKLCSSIGLRTIELVLSAEHHCDLSV